MKKGKMLLEAKLRGEPPPLFKLDFKEVSFIDTTLRGRAVKWMHDRGYKVDRGCEIEELLTELEWQARDGGATL